MPSKKLISIIFLSLFFFSVLPINAVTPNDFNDKFVGVNSIHLTDNFTPEKVDTSLSYLANSCGTSIIRLFLPYTDYPSLSNLKYTLQKGSEYGIKFIITLGDSWRLDPSLNFYPGDLEAYKQRARNTINELKNEYGSAIFAWELLNEPHCDYGKIKVDGDGNSTREFDPTCPNRLYNFVRDFSAEIKQLDPTHPVTIGLIGRHGDGRTVWSKFDPKTGPYANSDFVALNNIDTIDAAEDHVYGVSIETIQSDIDKANYINKPFFVEEYGPDGLKKPRAEQLREKMQGSFDYGANGFLVWEYSPPGNDGDKFYFNQDHQNSLCQVLKDEATRQNALPEAYDLGPLADFPSKYTPGADCNLEIMEFEDVHITEIKKGRRTTVAKHPRDQDPNYVANANLDNDGYTLVCSSSVETEEKITPENPNPDDPPVTQKTVKKQLSTDYSQAIESGKNLEARFSETLNPWADIKDIKYTFTSFLYPLSTAFRTLTSQKQKLFQYKRLENIALFLAGHDVISQESQLGWWNPDTQQCFTIGCGQPDNTQPIWLSQLAYYYRNELSPLAKSTLEKYYTSDQLLPTPCAQPLLQFLSPSTQGSLASQITIQQGDNAKTVIRGQPRTAISADPITQDLQNIAVPSSQQNTTTNQVCNWVKTPPSGSTSKVGLFQLIANFINGIFSVKGTVVNSLDPRLEKGTSDTNKFVQNLIPEKTIKKIKGESGSTGSTVNEEEEFNIIDPGVNPAYFKELNLHPANGYM